MTCQKYLTKMESLVREMTEHVKSVGPEVTYIRKKVTKYKIMHLETENNRKMPLFAVSVKRSPA